MKFFILLCVLFCSPLMASFTLTIEGGTAVTPPTGLPYRQLPDATNGAAWNPGVTIKCTNINPPIAPFSTPPFSGIQPAINPSPMGITFTRTDVSSTEVWFVVGGTLTDAPGTLLFNMGAIQTTYTTPTMGSSSSEAELCKVNVLAGGGGGDSSAKSSGGEDGGCSTTGRGSYLLIVICLGLAGVATLRLINRDHDYQANDFGYHPDHGRNLTEDEVKEWKLAVSAMTQEELAKLQRFAPAGHPVFDTKYSIYKHFEQCFNGVTPEISKRVGWGADRRA